MIVFHLIKTTGPYFAAHVAVPALRETESKSSDFIVNCFSSISCLPRTSVVLEVRLLLFQKAPAEVGTSATCLVLVLECFALCECGPPEQGNCFCPSKVYVSWPGVQTLKYPNSFAPRTPLKGIFTRYR